MKNFSLLLLLLICSTFTLSAQWAKVHESGYGNIGPIHTISNQELLVAHFYQSHLVKIENSEIQITNFEHIGFIRDIEFVNQQIGYIGGGCYYVGETCPATTLYKTTDGGKSWETLLYNFFPVGAFQKISLPSENDIYIYADCKGLLHSSDAGESWNPIDLPEQYSNHSYTDIQFLTPQLGFVAFIDGYDVIPNGYAWQNYVLVTKDGGKSWEQIFDILLPNNQISTISFATPDIGFLVDQRNHIYKTENGGQSWDTISIGSPQEEILSFELIDHKVAYLSTRLGEEFKSNIYKTEDGGLTWRIDASFDSVYVHQLDFVDRENGFAGIGNAIYQRTEISSYTTQSLSIDFKVFPNPSNEFINISFENASIFPLALIIRNQLGQIVLEKQLFSSSNTISIQHLLPNIYYIELLDDNGKLLGAKKLVKK